MSTVTKVGCMQSKSISVALAALAAIAFVVPGGAWAQSSAKPVQLAVSAIGRPPIFSNTFVDVGEAMGYWKAAGVDVTFRWFQRGADTARSVVTGDVAVVKVELDYPDAFLTDYFTLLKVDGKWMIRNKIFTRQQAKR